VEPIRESIFESTVCKKERALLSHYYTSLQIITFDILNNIAVYFKKIKLNAITIDNDIKQYIFFNTFQYMIEDLFAFSEKDPACGGDKFYIINSYLSFKAVVYYRIFSFIYQMDNLDKNYRRTLARCISEKCKVVTGIEIHPGASIGRRFIIDHGIGTVIGETCKIGDDCYVLQSVILGSKGIASNSNIKRHPTIGNNVEIGAFARILGPITIGDNVIISPHSVITSDIPSNSKITIRNQLQIIRNNKLELIPNISIIISETEDIIDVYVYNLLDPQLKILDENLCEISDIKLDILFAEKNHLKMKLISTNSNCWNSKISLRITSRDGCEVILLDSIELKTVICNFQKGVLSEAMRN
jgi:serine O-acetyltransferase